MSSALTSPTETMPRPSPLPAGDSGDARSPQAKSGNASRPETAQGRQSPSQSSNRPQADRATEMEAAGREARSGRAKQQDAVKEAVAELKRQLSTSLEFEIDEELDRAIVRVRNPETGDVIRQIPPEEMLALARQLREDQGEVPRGVLLDAQR